MAIGRKSAEPSILYLEVSKITDDLTLAIITLIQDWSGQMGPLTRTNVDAGQFPASVTSMWNSV